MMKRSWAYHGLVVVTALAVLAAAPDWRLDDGLGTVVWTSIAVAGIVAVSLLSLRLFDRVREGASDV